MGGAVIKAELIQTAMIIVKANRLDLLFLE